MTKNLLAAACAFVGVTLLFTGCQSDTIGAPKKQGSYTAARRYRLGSNIPQPDTIDNTNSVSTSEMDRLGATQSRMGMGSFTGGAR